MSNKKSIHGTTLALALAACAALPAAAQQTPWYGAFSAGTAKTDHEFVTNREGAISNATNIRTDFDDKDGAWKATLGYRVNSWLALEVNYADYGSVRSDTRFDVPGGLNGFGTVTIDREVKGFGVDGLVSAPLGDRFSVFGRVGAFRAETRASARIGGDTFFTDGTPGTERSNKSTETTVKYGVGVDWNFTPQFAARLEYERLDRVGKKFESGQSGTTGEAAVDTLMIGALLRF
jgi:OmpA-OmpF porin, OOP family